MKDQQAKQIDTGRQYDFKFALIMMLLLVWLISVTLSFPMSGSYGGVENQWYVSPALFPLFLLGALFICVSALLISTMKQKGYQDFFSLQHWIGDKTDQAVVDKWLIIGLLVIYVYVLIPSTDFYLATTVFVSSLTSIFYLQINHARKWILALNSSLILVLVLIRLHFQQEQDLSLLDINSLENSILYCDIATTLALAILLSLKVGLGFKKDKSKLIYSLIAALLVPLILILLFSFLLYVPMPVEYGTVINMLNWLIYEQFGL